MDLLAGLAAATWRVDQAGETITSTSALDRASAKSLGGGGAVTIISIELSGAKWPNAVRPNLEASAKTMMRPAAEIISASIDVSSKTVVAMPLRAVIPLIPIIAVSTLISPDRNPTAPIVDTKFALYWPPRT